MKTVTKRGHADWDDLIGKTISFDWTDGWDDYTCEMVVDRIETEETSEDPRYPRYYVLEDDSGGHSFWESEFVEVTVHD